MKFSRHDLKDLNGLTALAKSTYASGEIISEDYLDWEYKHNPSGNAMVFVVESESQIVSQYVVLPKKLVFENQLISGTLSLNTITHPGYRGRGYFTQLAEMTYSACENSGVDFTIGFPNANSVNGFLSKLKFVEIGRLPLLIKLVNPLKSVVNFISKGSRRYGNDIELTPISENVGVAKLNLVSDAGKYNVFWEKFKKCHPITTDRSTEFLKWRYIDIPLRKYQLFKFEIGGEIVAIAILRLKEIMGMRCGVLVDFLVLDKAIDVNYFFAELKKSKLDLFIATVPIASKEYKELKKVGFFKVPEILMLKKLHVIIRKHNKNISDSICDFKKWFITFGDYDIF